MVVSRSPSLFFALGALPVLLLGIGPTFKIISQLVTFFTVVSGSHDRVDTHIHALPAAYLNALGAASGDPSGYPSPEWTLDAAVKSMNKVGTSIGVLSVSSPGAPIAGTGEAGRKLARSLNEDLAEYSTESAHKGRIGFFGVLPDWQDVNGTLAELDFLYAQQKLCSGVTVYTSYGGKLLGDPIFTPIWTKLQEYKALVFMHPSVLDAQPRFINPGFPQPIVDYPLATTRAAVDLVMTGTVRSCPDVDIILSHAGGTLPFVGSRAINSLYLPPMSSVAKVDTRQAKADFGRFYYDIALSTSPAQLNGLLDFTDADHVVFGSDFPYVPQLGIDAMVLGHSKYVATNSRGDKIKTEVLTKNSLKLLRKHAQGLVFG